MCVHTQVTPLNVTVGTECVRLIFLQTWALREQGTSNAWIEASEGAVHKGSSRAVPSTPEQESHHQGMGSTNFCSIPAKEFLHQTSYQTSTDPSYQHPAAATGVPRPCFRAAQQQHSTAQPAPTPGSEAAPRSLPSPAPTCGPGPRSAPRRPHSHGPVAEALEDGERGAVAALQEERVDGAEQRSRRSSAARHGAARHSTALSAPASGGRGRARCAHWLPRLSVSALGQ